jgi:hypothetical protein
MMRKEYTHGHKFLNSSSNKETSDVPRNFIVGSSNKQSSVYITGVKSPAILEELVIIPWHISLGPHFFEGKIG